MFKKNYSLYAGFICGCAIFLMAAVAQAQNLYVSSYNLGIIMVVATNGTVQTNFTTGLNEPNGMAFSSAGNLFVANTGSGNIVEFTNYNGTVRTNVNVFAAGLSFPYGLAFDSAGDLFEADYGSHTINEFTNQNGTLHPTPGVFATNSTLHPVGLAFDGNGDLFEADYNYGTVNEFTNQNGVLNSTPGLFATNQTSPFGIGPEGLAVDTGGNLFVSINNTAGTIYKITPSGSQSTFATYQTSLTLDDPLGMAFDNAGNLYVANQAADKSSGGIIEYSPFGKTNYFASGLPQPSCVAFPPTVGVQMVVTNQPMYLNVSAPSPYYTIYPTVVQASTNLLNWTNVYTNTPPFSFVDPSNSQYSLRFYRAKMGH
jgi:sugar lactone lactonase YvrE